MPRGKKSHDKDVKGAKLSKKYVANVNSNHLQTRSERKKELKDNPNYNTDKSGTSGYQVKSKIVRPNVESKNAEIKQGKAATKNLPKVVQFEEEGEIVEMEIDDGGAAAHEFASDEELDYEDNPTDNDSTDTEGEIVSDEEPVMGENTPNNAQDLNIDQQIVEN